MVYGIWYMVLQEPQFRQYDGPILGSSGGSQHLHINSGPKSRV